MSAGALSRPECGRFRVDPHTVSVRTQPGPDEPTLDLHGLRVREALKRTDAFLRAEQASGTVAVRVVTGNGTGALRQAIGELLASHPSVTRVAPGLHTDAVRHVVLRPPRSR